MKYKTPEQREDALKAYQRRLKIQNAVICAGLCLISFIIYTAVA